MDSNYLHNLFINEVKGALNSGGGGGGSGGNVKIPTKLSELENDLFYSKIIPIASFTHNDMTYNDVYGRFEAVVDKPIGFDVNKLAFDVSVSDDGTQHECSLTVGDGLNVEEIPAGCVIWTDDFPLEISVGCIGDPEMEQYVPRDPNKIYIVMWIHENAEFNCTLTLIDDKKISSDCLESESPLQLIDDHNPDIDKYITVPCKKICIPSRDYAHRVNNDVGYGYEPFFVENDRLLFSDVPIAYSMVYYTAIDLSDASVGDKASARITPASSDYTLFAKNVNNPMSIGCVRVVDNRITTPCLFNMFTGGTVLTGGGKLCRVEATSYNTWTDDGYVDIVVTVLMDFGSLTASV